MNIEELGKKPASEITGAEFRILRRYRALKARQAKVAEEKESLRRKIVAAEKRCEEMTKDFDELGEEIVTIEQTVEAGKVESQKSEV